MINKKVNIIIICLVFVIIIVSTNCSVFALSFELRYKLEPPLPREFDISPTHELYIPEFNVKGIYVTGWAAGSHELMNNLINLTNNTVINSMVIDIKDQNGYLSYYSDVEFAHEIASNQNKIRDVRELIKNLKSKGIYLIARQVIFKDKRLAQQREDLALKLWDKGKNEEIISKDWVDPTEKEVWDYNIELAKEAISLGFHEIQFDYIRYPALANQPISVKLEDGKTKSDYINEFTRYANKKLANYDVPISVDVFGLTTAVDDDLGIGQNFSELSTMVDIISPMVYPSHYAPGSYGIKMPNTEPYKIIYHSLNDARENVNCIDSVVIRPWLQDFSMGHNYSMMDIVDQIKAAESLGIKEWLLWNPSSKYTEDALLYHHHN